MFLEKAVYSNIGKSTENGNEMYRPVVALIVEAGKFVPLSKFQVC